METPVEKTMNKTTNALAKELEILKYKREIKTIKSS